MPAFFKKTALFYLAAILLYLPINLYAGTWANWQHPLRLFSDIAFNGTFYHLWYLPAAIVGVGIIRLLLPKMKTKLSLAACLILYVVGLFGDSYYGITEQIPFLRSGYQIYFSFLNYTRNGLFFAPVFLMLGVLAARRTKPLPLRTCLIGLALSAALMLAEGLLLHKFAYKDTTACILLCSLAYFFCFAA
jgi:serine/alanine racemase